jgi:FtsP/CotA-like multicopper oxidase with cupredoxin domain
VKDTVVAQYGRVTVDFTADQPGPTPFHRHIQRRMDYGFTTLVSYG